MENIKIEPIKSAIRKRKRRGRGNASGMGGEAGRGHKGQKSRSGFSRKPGFEGGQMPLYRRLPKKKGIFSPFKVVYFPINLGTIDKKYVAGEVVDMDSLIQKGIVSKPGRIKVLGDGALSKELTIKVHAVSKSAEEKIKKASAKLEIIS